MKENITDALADDVLRGATAFQQLCWLAAGRIDSAALSRRPDASQHSCWNAVAPRSASSAMASVMFSFIAFPRSSPHYDARE